MSRDVQLGVDDGVERPEGYINQNRRGCEAPAAFNYMKGSHRVTDQSNDNSIRHEGEAFDPLDPIHDLPHEDVTDAAGTTDTTDIGDTTVDSAILQRLTHDDRGRLRIHIADDTAMYDQLVDRIGTGGLDYIYRNGESMVMATERGISAMGPDRLAAHINNQLAFIRGVGDEARQVMMRSDIARQLANAPESCSNIRELRGVLTIPTMRPDGTIISQRGYDEATQYAYIPTGVRVDVPDEPNDHDIATARKIIMTPFLEYQFKHGDSSMANASGTMITPALRLFDIGHRKAVKFGANQPGSGKSYIASGCSTVYDGKMHPPPESNAEMKKSITGILSEPGSVIYFDNVRGRAAYTSFEALLTSDRWSSRLLGSSRTVDLVNDRLWMMTSNNMRPSPDLARRLLCIDIVTDPDPTKRSFTIRDLDQWFKDHREEYLGAVLTLVRAWIQRGRPMPDDGESDSFSRWRRMIRGILEVAGIPGVFDAEWTRVVDTEESEEGTAFLDEVWSAFGDDEFLTKEVSLAVESGKIDPDSLPDKLARAWPGYVSTAFTKTLGQWFRAHDMTWFGGFAVTFTGNKRKNAKLLRVVRRGLHVTLGRVSCRDRRSSRARVNRCRYFG